MTTALVQATLRERMTEKARRQLARESASRIRQSPYWVAVYTKRVLCEHVRIETRNNGYGNHECLDCGMAV